MNDVDFWLNLSCFPAIMAIVPYVLFRSMAQGPIRLNRHIRRFLLPFSRKDTTSAGFIVIASSCYLVILLDLIGYLSGFKTIVGIYDFNLLCFSTFSAIISLFLAIYAIVNFKGTSIIVKIIYIALICIWVAYFITAFMFSIKVCVLGIQKMIRN